MLWQFFQRLDFFSVWQYFQHLAISASGNFWGYKFLKTPTWSATKPPSQQQRSATKPPADMPTSTVTLRTSSANSLRTDSGGWGKGGTSGFIKGHPHRVPLGGASSDRHRLKVAVSRDSLLARKRWPLRTRSDRRPQTTREGTNTTKCKGPPTCKLTVPKPTPCQPTLPRLTTTPLGVAN
jgi:hypothetical protein